MSDPADDIAALYERHAREWDADRQAGVWNDRPWHDRFIAILSNGGCVLDLGCGSGIPVARHMAERGLRITGIDSSPTLIALCRKRLPDHEWHVADMRRFVLSRKFDGVLAWDSFFHLRPDDQRAMFDIFAQAAGTGAALMFNAGPAAGIAMGEYRGAPLYHASLDPQDYATLLEAHGFDVIDHTVEDWKSAGGRTVWLARKRA